jgi:hypothetical protein
MLNIPKKFGRLRANITPISHSGFGLKIANLPLAGKVKNKKVKKKRLRRSKSLKG